MGRQLIVTRCIKGVCAWRRPIFYQCVPHEIILSDRLDSSSQLMIFVTLLKQGFNFNNVC